MILMLQRFSPGRPFLVSEKLGMKSRKFSSPRVSLFFRLQNLGGEVGLKTKRLVALITKSFIISYYVLRI